MGPIRDLKRVQKVLGCLAALSRFILQLDEKGLPLYQLLKKQERFSWTVEAQEALDKLKATLAHALILTPPQDGEPLYILLTVKIRQPSHEFTFGVGMTFVSYRLVLTPVV
jgi:hypothetical protein